MLALYKTNTAKLSSVLHPEHFSLQLLRLFVKSWKLYSHLKVAYMKNEAYDANEHT